MKIFMTAALAGLALTGCTKNESSESTLPIAGDNPITFSAEQTESRASFPGDTGDMVWDAYDHLGAYSLAPDGSLVQSDFCPIDAASAGTTAGVFTPSTHTERSAWVNTQEGDYTFYAYYPQLTAPHATYADGSLALELPAVQTGTFGQHQICVSSAVTMSRANVLDANNPIAYAFKPATSLLRIRLTLSAESAVAETTVKALKVSAAGASLAGACRLTLADGTLVSTATTVPAESSVTVQLATPVTITKTAAENPYIDLVILPCTPTGDLEIIATAGDTNYLLASQKAPAKGFQPGLRYSLDREITLSASDGSYYYYGSANCYLALNGSATIDITPRKATDLCETTAETAANIPTAVRAELLWKERTITAINVPATVSGNSFTVTGIAGTGNAVVAIKDAADNILWSYHIWVPETDPTQGLLTYSVTNSGDTYQVLPMALGATRVATLSSSDEDKAASCGLYYQWGRKDPLGRAASVSDNSTLVAAVDGSNTAFTYPTTLQSSLSLPAENQDRYMIDYVTAHPTEFIAVANGVNSNNWTVKTNQNLWSNPKGYDFPKASTVKKSIYDPCPTGYRVAPTDLFINFSTTKTNTYLMNDSKKETFNASNASTYQEDKGYDFYYAGTKTGTTDFYPASGCRSPTSGALTYVGSGGCSWSSAPYGSGSTNAGTLSFAAVGVSPLFGDYRAFGFPVRCVKEQ